jgi:hypothetical protein
MHFGNKLVANYTVFMNCIMMYTWYYSLKYPVGDQMGRLSFR